MDEPAPNRQFVRLVDRLELADLDDDVAADELARRLSEGLTDFAELVRLARELPPERWLQARVAQQHAGPASTAPRLPEFSAELGPNPPPAASTCKPWVGPRMARMREERISPRAS